MSDPYDTKSMTSDEFLDRLATDKEFADEVAARWREARHRIPENLRIQELVLEDLRLVGVDVDSISDLVDPSDYEEAVPVLLEWLQKTDSPDVKTGLARALAEPWADPEVARVLLNEFESAEPDSLLQTTLGGALGAMAEPSLAETFMRLASESRYGGARGILVRALGVIGDTKAVKLLVELLEDSSVATDAVVALGLLGAPEAIEPLQPFLEHPESWVRNEARKALQRIQRR